MHRARLFATSVVCVIGLAATGVRTQESRLDGRWQGMVRSAQGERRGTVTIRKEGDRYVGSLSGFSGTTELPFQEIRREGDRVTAKMQVDVLQGSAVVNFDFVVKGDTLEGKGELNLGAQALTFTYEMKRIGDVLVKQEVDPLRRLDYFAGEWSFEMTARESPFGPGGSLKGTASFTPVLENRFLESRLECKVDAGLFQKSGFIGYDFGNKTYTFFENLPGGIASFSAGQWVGPAIRAESAPLQVKDQTYRLRRVLSVVSDNSFTVKDEFSVDGGPFQRLGNGTFSKLPQSGRR